MEPLSCQNCCHNPMRLDIVGSAVGYCTQHDVVLSSPSSTTCGRLLRKDMLFEEALLLQKRHGKQFSWKQASSLYGDQALKTEQANGQLHRDAVADEAMSFARYERRSKRLSLSALRRVPGIRAEVALHSLARAWSINCWKRGRDKRWTAPLHEFWWALNALDRVPADPLLSEIHDADGLPVARRESVAKWSVVVLRLFFIADVGRFAAIKQDDVGELHSIADDALEHTEPGDAADLLRWLHSNATRLRKHFPESRYRELASELHRD